MLFEDGVGFCPWHKRDSSFTVVHAISHISPHFYSPLAAGPLPSGGPPDDSMRTGLVVLECLHCHKTVILLETKVRFPSKDVGGIGEERTWRSMVWPAESPRALHESAPEAVRGLFAEASNCEKAKAFRAAGVMYRSAVEELVKDQGATGRDLYSRIDSLNGRLPAELVEDLHEARMLGNDSIHAGITYSADEVEDIAKLIEEAVLVLYLQPEQKRAMRDARKARREAAKA